MSLQWRHRHYHLDSPILNGVCCQLCYKKLDDFKKRNYWYLLNYSELNWRLCVFLSTSSVIKFLVDMELYVFLHDLAIITSLLLLILFRMDVFGAAHGWDSMQNDPPPSRNLSLICPWYLIPSPKTIKNIYKSLDGYLEFCWHQHFIH